MLSGPSFRLGFVFSINSLILFGFALTSFHLTDALISAFLWLHTLVCAVVQNYLKLLILSVFIFQSICYSCRIWKRKQTMEKNRALHVNKQNQNKSKTKSRHVTFKLTFYFRLSQVYFSLNNQTWISPSQIAN